MFIARSLPADRASSPAGAGEPAVVDGFVANIERSLAKLSANQKENRGAAERRMVVENSNQIKGKIICLPKIHSV
jgi:hypothetical protein